MLFPGKYPVKFFILLFMPGIKPVIADHFKLSFRDVLYKSGDKFHNRNRFGDKSVVFMPVIVKRNGIAIIRVNAGGGNDGAPKVSANIFKDDIRYAVFGFGIDIKPIFMIIINGRFPLLKGIAKPGVKKIKKRGTEGKPQERKGKVSDSAPWKGRANGAFGDKTMNMRIPFQVPAKGMKNTNKTGNKGLGFINLVEHAQNNTADSRKEAV